MLMCLLSMGAACPFFFLTLLMPARSFSFAMRCGVQGFAPGAAYVCERAPSRIAPPVWDPVPAAECPIKR